VTPHSLTTTATTTARIRVGMQPRCIITPVSIPSSALFAETNENDNDSESSKNNTFQVQEPTTEKTTTTTTTTSTKKTTLDPKDSKSISAVSSKRSSSRSSSSSSSSSSNYDLPQLKKSTSETRHSNKWNAFDYNQHWYPVIWECDLPVNKPTKVTLFDVDYVVARHDKGGYIALQDLCPHKAAALSEGRITSSGYLQCAYHGWSFDGTNGNCVQIPQAATAAAAIAAVTSHQEQTPPQVRRACAKAIPLTVHQGMVWLWPGPVQDIYPTPPTIPEIDEPGWTTIKVVRDFPNVDWSLLLSNILDPDHGCFAHTQLAFDFYSASSEHPLHVEESFDDAGWTLTGQVDAVDKVMKVDQKKRMALGMKTKKKTSTIKDLKASTFFQAPTTVGLCRRDSNGDTKFITAFWVTPVGTGRSRFMTAAVSNALPFKLPRWMFSINLNRFLDQDTVLVASQQPPLLKAEAQGVEMPRASLFTYGSATDKTVRLIDQFWDNTLYKAPNRQRTLQHLYQSGQLDRMPSREEILDRQTQHLDVCPDSQGFVRKCRLIRNGCLAGLAAALVRALWQRALPTNRWQSSLLLLGAGIVAWATDQLQRQFFFVKTASSRDKDLRQIPIKAWLDP